MTFTLGGFKEKGGVRQFLFKGAASDRSAMTVVVCADVTLARKHEIRLQELPLLCVRLLESIEDTNLAPAITLTEDHMIAIQAAARDKAEKKPHHPPRRPSPAAGQAWRNTQI
jgi:hypothetical protein